MKMSEVEDSPFRKGAHKSSTVSSTEFSSLSVSGLGSGAPTPLPSPSALASLEKSAECVLAVLATSTSDSITFSSPITSSSSFSQNQSTSTPSPGSSGRSKKSSGSSRRSSSRSSSQNPESTLEASSASGGSNKPPTSSSSSGIGTMPPLNRSNSNISNQSANGSPVVVIPESGSGAEMNQVVSPVKVKTTAADDDLDLKSDSEVRERESGEYEEETEADDNSVVSDVSRGDQPSDSFHTPSASLHNLPEAKEYGSDFETTSISSQLGKEDFSHPPDENSPKGWIVGPGSRSAYESGSNYLDYSASLSTPGNGNGALSELTQSLESNISRESSSSSGNNSATKDVLLLPGTYNSKPSKKKMWYHVFTPSYKTKSSDFRKYFKDLPVDERLIVDYSCALQKEILVQGRMYISQNYVSFYANIFGWQTNLVIRLKDVTSITKENTALVIPNAIQLNTQNEKYFFTSLVSRDSTYIMLFKLWQSSLIDETIPTKELWKLVHASYGEELGLDSEEESEDFLSLSSGSLVNAPSVATLLSLTDDGEDNKSIKIDPACLGEGQLGEPLGSNSVPLIGGGIHKNNRVTLVVDGKLPNGGPVPTDLSDSSDSEDEHLVVPDLSIPVEIPQCPVPHHEGRTLVDTIIPCDVDQLFTMLFTNSKFFLDFHLSRKTSDINQSEWTEGEGNRTVRQVTLTLTLNNKMGPKHSQVTETQVMLPVSKPGVLYAVDTESINAGIPYADAFYVTCHFCLSRGSPRESRLIIICQVKYLKSVWVKPFIEKNSYSGLEEFYSSLVASLKEECEKSNIIAASPPPSPRIIRQGGSLPRTVRRRVPGKRRAPDIPTIVPPRVGGIQPNSAAPIQGISTDSEPASENSLVVRIILSVLALLLLLNAFLYIKLTQLETTAHSPLVFSSQPISFTKDMPQNHQEWLLLLQKQEALHRFELQKWHDILLSALKILHQAELDLESLKLHMTSYSEVRGKEIPGYSKTSLRSEGTKSVGSKESIITIDERQETETATK